MLLGDFQNGGHFCPRTSKNHDFWDKNRHYFENPIITCHDINMQSKNQVLGCISKKNILKNVKFLKMHLSVYIILDKVHNNILSPHE